jgi:hypothetical protein
MFKLRAHHVLCFLGFRGLGYNQPFVQKFALIRARILSSPELVLQLGIGADDICNRCPKLSNGVCTDNDNVRKKDEFVIGFLTTDKISVKSAYQRIKTLEEEKFRNLCEYCEWYSLGFCLKGLRILKQDENRIFNP